jgi:endonuclease-3
MIQPTDLDWMLPAIEERTREMPPLYISHRLHDIPDLQERAFKILVSSIISLRTKEKATWAVSERLYARVSDIEGLLSLSVSEMEQFLFSCGFYKQKTRQIREVCQILQERYDGRVPDTIEDLLTLPGVGRKVANLVVTEAFEKEGLCVDIHVHRICNRWQWVKTKDPDATEMALRQILPHKYWRVFNQRLVMFGQNICLPVNPRCSNCFLKAMCPSAQRLSEL